MAEQYRCLHCGGTEGSPSDSPGFRNWYWRNLEFGRVGPFDTEECSKRFVLPTGGEPLFTLRQFSDLSFLAYRYREGM